MPTAIKPEKILKELAKLWVDLAKEETDKNSAGVLRACAMTLIVAVEEGETATADGAPIAEVMQEHPTRAIGLHVAEGCNSAGLDARVFPHGIQQCANTQASSPSELEITAPES